MGSSVTKTLAPGRDAAPGIEEENDCSLEMDTFIESAQRISQRNSRAGPDR